MFPSILPRQVGGVGFEPTQSKKNSKVVGLEGIEPTRCQSREIYSLPRLLNGLQTQIFTFLPSIDKFENLVHWQIFEFLK